MARQKLVESWDSWGDKRLILREIPKNALKEAFSSGPSGPSDQAPQEIFGGYIVPVWRLNKKNLNGRVYSESLAKAVCSNPKVTFAFADHPQDEENASVWDIVAIGKNPFIEDGFLKAECYFVHEDFYRKVRKMIELGSGIGLSSTSWGDVDDEGNVLLEGFEIERYFDFVVSPSYQVYLDSSSEKIENQEDTIKENRTGGFRMNENDNNLNSASNINNVDTLSLLLRDNIVSNVENIINSLHKTKSFVEKKRKLDKIRPYIERLSDKKLTEKYAAALKSLEDELIQSAQKSQKIEVEFREQEDKVKKLLKRTQNVEKIRSFTAAKYSEVREELDKVRREYNRLKEKYDNAVELLDSSKEMITRMKGLLQIREAETNAKVSAKDYSDLVKYTETLEKENRVLKSKLKGRGRNWAEAEGEKTISKSRSLGSSRPSPGDEEMEDMFDDNEDIGYGFGKDEYGLDIWNEREVRAYYQDLIQENPNYSLIKDKILRCKTVYEASLTALQHKDIVESFGPMNSSLRESGSTSLAPRMHQDSRKEIGDVDVKRLLKPGMV